MLVLSRKRGEQIVIGNGLARIAVTAIQGDKVRLGIEAERSVPVHRAEVFEAIQRKAQAVAENTEQKPEGDAA